MWRISQSKKEVSGKGQVTESLDDSYLEVQAALEDMRISSRMDNRPRVKVYIPTGIITPKMAGMSSVQLDDTIASAGFLTVVSVKHSGKQPNWDDEDKTKHTHLKSDEKYSFFCEMGVDVESVQNSEIKSFATFDALRVSKIVMDSWNDSRNYTIPSDTKHPINEKRKQRHSTTPKKHNTSIPTQRKTHSNNKPANTTCNSCHKKVTALVGPTCQDCFLRGAN